MRRWLSAVTLLALVSATGCAPTWGGEPTQHSADVAATAALTASPKPGPVRGSRPGGREEPTPEARPGSGAEAVPEVPRIPREWVPAINQVVTLRLSLGLPTPPQATPQPLYATHPSHRFAIAYLLDRLAESQLIPGEISPPARAPSLQVGLKNGAFTSARLAYDCTPFTSETGHGYTCRQAPGELILQTTEGREVRVANPTLAAWLVEGWRLELPVGPVPDLDRESALAIAREIDAKAPWKAAFHQEYPVERKGETELHRAWVVDAEFPSGNTVRLVIDALSGELLRAGQLETLE